MAVLSALNQMIAWGEDNTSTYGPFKIVIGYTLWTWNTDM